MSSIKYNGQIMEQDPFLMTLLLISILILLLVVKSLDK